MFYLPVELADPKMGQPFLCVEIILVHETFKSQRSRFKHKLLAKISEKLVMRISMNLAIYLNNAFTPAIRNDLAIRL